MGNKLTFFIAIGIALLFAVFGVILERTFAVSDILFSSDNSALTQEGEGANKVNPAEQSARPELNEIQKRAETRKRESARIYQTIRSALKDPSSAQFSNISHHPDFKWACVGVNARNSYGGFSGEQQATVVKRNGVYEVASIDDFDAETCWRLARRDYGGD